MLSIILIAYIFSIKVKKMLAKIFFAFLGCAQVAALSVVSTSGNKIALKIDGIENE